MGFSFNQVTVGGTLTRDPELRYTPSGTAVLDISLAVNDRKKGANGEWVDTVDFIEVTLFGRMAEVVTEYSKKGGSLLVAGKLKQEQWQSKEGQKRSKLKVLGDRVQLVGGGKGSQGGGQSGGQRSGARQEQQSETSYSGGDDGPPDEEVPF